MDKSADMKIITDSPRKGLEAPQRTRSKWLYGAAGVGLLLLGLVVGLAIGLPLAFKNRGTGESVPLSAGGAGEISNIKGTTRTYYLAADPIDWDYVPTRKNLCTNQPFSEESALYVTKGIGSKYKKAVYRQYKDDSFQVWLGE